MYRSRKNHLLKDNGSLYNKKRDNDLSSILFRPVDSQWDSNFEPGTLAFDSRFSYCYPRDGKDFADKEQAEAGIFPDPLSQIFSFLLKGIPMPLPCRVMVIPSCVSW